MQRDLAERARRGDHDAFTALVDGSIGRLYAVAYLILRDRDRAHDAVQEALVAAWRDIHGVRDPDRIDAWFRRLVVRACYRQARLERRRTVVELRVVPGEPPVSPSHELTVVDRDRLERGFARLGPDPGRSSCSPTISGCRSRRSPRPSTSRAGPRSPA